MNYSLKINGFTLENLHNTGDSAFLERICNATKLLTEEADQAMIATFKEAFKAFNDVVKLKNSFITTEEIIRLDNLADSAWRGMHAQVKVMLRHPSEETRAIAHEAMKVIDKYGDITNLSYNDEYGAMDNLSTDIYALGAEKLQKIYLTDWVDELTLRRAEFMEAQATREEEKAQLEAGETKAKRKIADNAYRSFVKMVNAKALVLGVAPYEAFIKRANVIIDEAKLEISHRRSSRKAESEDKPDVKPDVDPDLPAE